jgi:hypothetical protein
MSRLSIHQEKLFLSHLQSNRLQLQGWFAEGNRVNDGNHLGRIAERQVRMYTSHFIDEKHLAVTLLATHTEGSTQRAGNRL